MNNENDPDSRLKGTPEESRMREWEKWEERGAMEEDLGKYEYHQFSPKHERRMKKLFQDETRRRPFRWEYNNFAEKLVLGSFLLFFAVFVGAAADAIPMPMINFSLHSKGNHSEIKMLADAEWGKQIPLFMNALYEPMNIPAGYERMIAEEKPANYKVNYTNGENDISFIQSTILDAPRVNDEYGKGKKMVVAGNAYYFYDTAHENFEDMLTWTAGNYQFQIYSHEDVNIILKMAESVKEVN